MATAPESLTQALRDEIIQDIKNIGMTDFSNDYVRKFGAFPQTRCAVLVNVEDELERQNITDNIRLMLCTVLVAVAIQQDREGNYLDYVSSYIEQYVRTARVYDNHAGFRNCRSSQMLGQSRRMDVYGQDGWFVNSFEFTVPYMLAESSPSSSI